MNFSQEKLEPTNKTTYNFKGLSIVHEFYDGTDKFRHRLTALDFGETEWAGYNSFVEIEIDGRKFRACMDSWHGQFPACFEIIEGDKL